MEPASRISVFCSRNRESEMSKDRLSFVTDSQLIDEGDPDAFHQTLSRWNRERFAVAMPDEGWVADIHTEHAMRLVEGAFIERFRAQVAERAAQAPRDTKGFVAWFEALKQDGPGQNDPLFPWLAEEASLEEMRWF